MLKSTNRILTFVPEESGLLPPSTYLFALQSGVDQHNSLRHQEISFLILWCKCFFATHRRSIEDLFEDEHQPVSTDSDRTSTNHLSSVPERAGTHPVRRSHPGFVHIPDVLLTWHTWLFLFTQLQQRSGFWLSLWSCLLTFHRLIRKMSRNPDKVFTCHILVCIRILQIEHAGFSK